MRIAYIGNFEPEFSTENDVRRAFEHLGHEVVKLQENSFQYAQLLDFNYDMLLITGTWAGYMALEMWLDVIHMCAKRGIPTATLHLDTFWSTGRDNRRWWTENMFHTAYIFTADGDYQKEWELLGKNHIWLPPGVRHESAKYGQYIQDYACDVAFVGSNGQGYHEDVWGYRKQLVDALREMCIRNNWSFKNPGGDSPKIDRGDDMNNFYASATVTVGDSLCLKKEDSHYWSDRVPEATGRGGFLIMPKIFELKRLYNESIPMYDWGDFPQLEGLVRFYLHNTAITQKLRDRAHKTTKREHTYVNRVQTIIKEVGLK